MLTPDGKTLRAVNTLEYRLEVVSVSGGSLTHVDSIPVGMEPVAVAARDNNEIWVVNHLSDSVSIVDLSASPAKVVRTLLVGDEPRDIHFAGTAFNRAFITTAHPGPQRHPTSLSGVPLHGNPTRPQGARGAGGLPRRAAGYPGVRARPRPQRDPRPDSELPVRTEQLQRHKAHHGVPTLRRDQSAGLSDPTARTVQRRIEALGGDRGASHGGRR